MWFMYFQHLLHYGWDLTCIPLLSEAEQQLVIVRTCRPFPLLHKGHASINDPFCKPNASGNSKERHYPVHPWPWDKNRGHFTGKNSLTFTGKIIQKWIFLLVFNYKIHPQSCTLLAFAISLCHFKTYSWRRIRKSVITLLLPVHF